MGLELRSVPDEIFSLWRFHVRSGFVIARAEFQLIKPPQTSVYTKWLIWACRAAHYKGSLPPAEEFPYYKSGGSLEYPLSSRPGCPALDGQLIPHIRLSAARNPPYLGLRIGPTPPEEPPPTRFVKT